MPRAVAAAIAALFALLASSERPRPDAQEQSTALMEQQLAQNEEIFGFGFGERIYDRSIATLESINTRLGVLVAAQAAIAIVLIDRVAEFGSWPVGVFLGLMAGTSISYFVQDAPEIAKVGLFLHQFPRAPRKTRSSILEGFPAAVAFNERRIRFRGQAFNVSILLTLLVLVWALRQNLIYSESHHENQSQRVSPAVYEAISASSRRGAGEPASKPGNRQTGPRRLF